MKIVINADFGGFGLSDEAIRMYARRKDIVLVEEKTEHFTLFYKNEIQDGNLFWEGYIERNDLDLVAVVEELGENANGRHSSLAVIEIPDGVEWQLMEYDGREWIAEKHRTWP
jgi:hypothetical protein